MLDLFAHEYGYTTEQFLDLTSRQIFALRKAIARRKVVDRYPWFQFLAQIKGLQIKSLEEILDPEFTGNVDFDDQTDAILERRAKEILEQGKQNNGR